MFSLIYTVAQIYS